MSPKKRLKMKGGVHFLFLKELSTSTYSTFQKSTRYTCKVSYCHTLKSKGGVKFMPPYTTFTPPFERKRETFLCYGIPWKVFLLHLSTQKCLNSLYRPLYKVTVLSKGGVRWRITSLKGGVNRYATFHIEQEVLMAVLSLSTDIKSLIEYYAGIQTVGKPVRVRGVLEYHSNCPWCGGEDRFITRPEEGTYSCSTRASGCGRFGDMIAFLREYCDMSFREACEAIGVDPSELGCTAASVPSAQAYGPPNKTWQQRGDQIVARAQTVLRSTQGKDALDYLRARGFIDDTIIDKRLGYIPLDAHGRWHDDELEKWGLTAKDTGKDKIWLYEGILIPWYVGGKLWKLDVRRLNGLKKDDPKILSITGSIDCLYNHNSVKAGKPAIICESALCAISGEQEAGDIAAFVATGGAGKHNSAWVRHLEQATVTLLSLDLDEPDANGKRAGDEGAVYWERNLSYQVRWHPYKKDINDMLVSGDNIREWADSGISWYYELEAAKEPVIIESKTCTSMPIAEELEPSAIDESLGTLFHDESTEITAPDALAIPEEALSLFERLRSDTLFNTRGNTFYHDQFIPLRGANNFYDLLKQDLASTDAATYQLALVQLKKLAEAQQ